jgi:hypothetical protein
MRLKIVIVDFEIPPRVKRWVLRVGIPAVVLVGGTAVAYATSLPVTWSSGQTLQAADLNNNFSYLQNEIAGDGGVGAEVAALEAQVAALQTSVTALQTQVVAHAHLEVAQQLPYGTLEVLNFDTKDFDTASAMTTSPMVFTAPSTGTYRVSVGLTGHCPNDVGAGGGATVTVFRNGASLQTEPDGGLGPTSSFGITYYYSVSDNGWSLSGSDLVALNMGDTLTLQAYQDLCSSSTVGTVNDGQVAIEKVSNGG